MLIMMTKKNHPQNNKNKRSSSLSVARKLIVAPTMTTSSSRKKRPLKTKKQQQPQQSKCRLTVDLDQIEHHQYRTSLAARGRLAQQFGVTAAAPTATLEGTVLWAPTTTTPLRLTLRGSSFGHQQTTVLNTNTNNNQAEPGEMLILLCDLLLQQHDDDEQEEGEGKATIPVVLKLRCPLQAIEDEMDRTRRMHARASALMPTMHAFVQLKVAGRTYGGICMQRLDYTATELLFPSTFLFRQPNMRETLLAQAARFHQHQKPLLLSNDDADEEEEGGVGVDPLPSFAAEDGEDEEMEATAANNGRLVTHLQTAVMLACLRLLRRLHLEAGWCHGDSHLGNFLIDSRRWRVYVIDFERAFECSSNRQQWFLDDQELFGHASGLLRTEPRWDGWELENTLPMYAQLHPESPWCRLLLNKKRKEEEEELLRLTPICTCFINNDLEERLGACDLCRSALNRANAERYYNNNTTPPLMLMPITHVRKIVRAAKRALEQKLMAPLLASVTLHHERVHDLLRVFQRGGKLHHSSLLLLQSTTTGLSPLFLNFRGLTPEDTVVLRERLCDVLYRPTLLLRDQQQCGAADNQGGYALLERLGLLQSPPSALLLLPR